MTGGLPPVDSLPPVDASLVPADVRKAGPKQVQLYETALSFEGLLDEQLAQSLASNLQGDPGSDGTQDDASSSLTAELLPQALGQGLLAAGGLGLAPELYRALGGTTGGEGA